MPDRVRTAVPSRSAAGQARAAVVTIGRASLVTWRRELMAALSLSPRAGALLLAGAALATLMLGVTLAALTSQALGGQGLPAQLLDAIALSSASAMCLMAALVAVVVNLVAPRETALTTLLDLLPVPRALAAFGANLPTLASGVAVGVVLAIPTMWLAWSSKQDPGLVVVLAVAVIACVGALNIMITVAFAAVRRVAERYLRLPPHIGLAVAGGALILASVAGFGRSALTDGLAPDAGVPAWMWFTPQGLVAAVVRGDWSGRLTSTGMLVAWCVVGAALFGGYFSARMERSAGAARRPHVLVGVAIPRGRRPGLVLLDVLVLLRAPQFVVTLLLVPAGAVATRLVAERGVPAELTTGLAGVLMVTGMVLVGQATGVVLPYRWAGRAVVGGDPQWVRIKIVSTAAVHAAVALAAWGCLVLAGAPLPQDGWSAVGTVLLAWASALLGGAVAPYDERHSLSPGVTLAFSALLYSSSSFAIGVLPLPAGPSEAAASLAVAAAFVAFFTAVCVRLDAREPARA